VTLEEPESVEDAVLPSGCRFHPRCPDELPECSERTPALATVDDRDVACFLHHDVDLPESNVD
jgi:oligopeptide/dipeptide ABC transporter ATP-binding protein